MEEANTSLTSFGFRAIQLMGPVRSTFGWKSRTVNVVRMSEGTSPCTTAVAPLNPLVPADETRRDDHAQHEEEGERKRVAMHETPLPGHGPAGRVAARSQEATTRGRIEASREPVGASWRGEFPVGADRAPGAGVLRLLDASRPALPGRRVAPQVDHVELGAGVTAVRHIHLAVLTLIFIQNDNKNWQSMGNYLDLRYNC